MYIHACIDGKQLMTWYDPREHQIDPEFQININTYMDGSR